MRCGPVGSSLFSRLLRDDLRQMRLAELGEAAGYEGLGAPLDISSSVDLAREKSDLDAYDWGMFARSSHVRPLSVGECVRCARWILLDVLPVGLRTRPRDARSWCARTTSVERFGGGTGD